MTTLWTVISHKERSVCAPPQCPQVEQLDASHYHLLQVNLKQFLGVDLKKVSKTSLTMMESLEELHDPNVRIDPMELQTFSIEF